jgi:hypothetical protein
MIDDLRVAVWDVLASRYAFAAALVAITSAPLCAVSIEHWLAR